MYARYFKRWFDIFLALMSLFVLFIPLSVIALITKIDTPGPAFFLQERFGRGRRPFKIVKFRSMPVTIPKNLPTSAITDPMLTRWERWLRKTSIDELPQIWNILKGDMSFVGPRPVITRETDLIDEREKYGANDVRPGLTGWAQINGRDELPIDVKAAFDGEYVRKMSFLFDCKCFFGTIVSVLKHEGVVEGGTGQMEKEKKLP